MHIVEIFQRIDQLLHFFRFFAAQFGFVLRAHGHVAVFRFEAGRFERGFHFGPVARCGDHFKRAVVVGGHIFGAGFERGFHQRVFIEAGGKQ